MTGPLLYNPIRVGRDELEAMLVARREVVDQLIADLVTDAGKKTRRHWQLIGPRGSGKSHLTQLVALRLAGDHGWAVARLPEEHYQVANVGELLEQIVMRLEDRDESPLAEVSSTDLEERALDRIRAFAAASGKPLLVIVENLAILFERQLRTRRDQQRLRQILSKSPPFALVATATRYVDATVQHAAPFYDFLQVVDLDELTSDEVVALIEARVAWDRDPALLGALDRVRARVRAMYHFSGGNPRLVLALYAIVRAGVTDELYQGLLKLLDEMTPYYQAQLGDLSPQMARVLTELALHGSDQSASDLARRCRLPTNQITAHIAKLEAACLVRPIARGQDRRRRHYDLVDRLFRLWIQMREDRTTRERLRFLAAFYERWYDGANASGDGAPYAQAVARMLSVESLHANDQPLAAADRRGVAVLSAYERLRDAQHLPADFPPYSTAVEVSATPHRAATLAPELREAVELLLAPPPARWDRRATR